MEWGQGTLKKARPYPARAYTTLVVLVQILKLAIWCTKIFPINYNRIILKVKISVFIISKQGKEQTKICIKLLREALKKMSQKVEKVQKGGWGVSTGNKKGHNSKCGFSFFSQM